MNIKLINHVKDPMHILNNFLQLIVGQTREGDPRLNMEINSIILNGGQNCNICNLHHNITFHNL